MFFCMYSQKRRKTTKHRFVLLRYAKNHLLNNTSTVERRGRTGIRYDSRVWPLHESHHSQTGRVPEHYLVLNGETSLYVSKVLRFSLHVFGINFCTVVIF